MIRCISSFVVTTGNHMGSFKRMCKLRNGLLNNFHHGHQNLGHLYFGVEDETLQVKGTTFNISKQKAEGNQSLEIYLRRMVSPKIIFKIEEFLFEGSLRIVVFIIPAATKEPTCYMGKPYIRIIAMPPN